MSVVLEEKRKVRSPYLDRIAKVSFSYVKLNRKGSLREDGKICGEFAITGKCENGHHYLKILYCGREWCPLCREQSHNRRISRWLPRIAVMKEGFGLFVFTIPEQLRVFYMEKENLSQLRSYIRKRLRQIYGPNLRGLARWHWFSEKNPYKYHPHLNVMLDSFQKLSKEELRQLKEDYKRALERFTGQKIASETNPEGKVDVHYQFVSASSIKEEFLKIQRREKKQSKILRKKHIKAIRKRLASGESLDEVCQDIYRAVRYHRLRYITRPTFLQYEAVLAKKLHGFRNCSVWGKNWPKLSYEEIERMAKEWENYERKGLSAILLGQGICPVCGGEIKWDSRGKVKYSNEFLLGYHCEDLGNGYYRIGEKQIRGSPKLNWKAFKENLKWKKLFLSEQAENIRKWLVNEQQRRDIWD